MALYCRCGPLVMMPNSFLHCELYLSTDGVTIFLKSICTRKAKEYPEEHDVLYAKVTDALDIELNIFCTTYS